MTFSEISKQLRKEKGLSQIQLATALNISKACISMIEIGKNEPTANTLIKYANFFECSTDYLLGREDDFGNITIQNENTAPALTEQERRMLELYRKLPPYLQENAYAELKGMLIALEVAKKEKKL
jgi:transcriptional regulator with XRE-family HTH domain